MKNNKRGISLIVLIVTIIVIIILAAVVILTLSKNNPVESARKARFMEDVRSFQDELALSISKDYVTKKENRNEKFNATDFDKIKEYIPSFTKDYEKKLYVKDDELMYEEDNVTEKEKNWLEELGIGKKESFAKKVKEDPITYYGQYVTNYTTDHSETENAVEKWQIFHSDGEHIYLIADDYISYQYAPNGKNNSEIYHNESNYCLSFKNVYKDYEGSKDIINYSKSNKWISWVDKYPDSTNENIRAVAYMLDTSENVWGKYAGSKAEYAIGSPTLEMFVESYNRTHKEGEQLECKEMGIDGYRINIGVKFFNDSGEFNKLYVIPESTKTCIGMWLASPHNSRGCDLMCVRNSGIVSSPEFSNSSSIGLRPLVCLKSDVTLKKVSGGFEIE